MASMVFKIEALLRVDISNEMLAVVGKSPMDVLIEMAQTEVDNAEFFQSDVTALRHETQIISLNIEDD